MKLEDIDVLNNWRTTYNTRKQELKAATNSPIGPVTFGAYHIRDTDILHKVRHLVIPLIKEKHDEAKTKLMMLGITEFPE